MISAEMGDAATVILPSNALLNWKLCVVKICSHNESCYSTEMYRRCSWASWHGSSGLVSKWQSTLIMAEVTGVVANPIHGFCALPHNVHISMHCTDLCYLLIHIAWT